MMVKSIKKVSHSGMKMMILFFGVDMDNTINGSDDTLFNRSAQINEAFKTSNQYTIKQVALSPNGIPAESWLFGGTQTTRDTATGKDEKNAFYSFMLYANERDATPEKSNLNIGFGSEYKKCATAKRR